MDLIFDVFVRISSRPEFLAVSFHIYESYFYANPIAVLESSLLAVVFGVLLRFRFARFCS